MAAPYSAEWYRQTYGERSVAGTVAAATAGVNNVIAVPSTSHTIYVQKISVNITTLGAQSITFQDDANTPIPIFFIEASAAAGAVRTIDFGAEGIPLTEGKNLDISGTAAPAYSYSVEAYAKQTAAVASTSINRTI